MSEPEKSQEQPIDLDKLRDDVLAGRETGHKPPNWDEMTDEERRNWPPHIINPALHPEIDFTGDPDIEKLREIARKRRGSQTGQQDMKE